MKRIPEFISIIVRPFLLMIYFLAGLLPRKPNIWVFGSNGGENFSGNPKYLFLYCSQHRSREIRPIWISRNPHIVAELKEHGYEAYLLYSCNGILACLKGGTWLFDHSTDDITYYLANGATTINLWHGMPLKKVGWDDLFSKWLYAKGWRKYAYRLVLPWFFERYDMMLIPCAAGVAILAGAFHQPRNTIYVAPYPRTMGFIHEIPDVLIGCPGSSFMYLSHLRKGGTRIVMYMPTFRDRSDERFFNIVNMYDFDKFLGKHRLCLAIKAHPRSSLTKKVDSDRFANVVVIPGSADPYPYLTITDVLITDYSSIYFEFLLVNRPIIFFCYDLKEYTSQNRGLYFEYNHITPGPKVDSIESLYYEIIKSTDESYYAVERLSLFNMLRFKEMHHASIDNTIDYISSLAKCDNEQRTI